MPRHGSLCHPEANVPLWIEQGEDPALVPDPGTIPHLGQVVPPACPLLTQNAPKVPSHQTVAHLLGSGSAHVLPPAQSPPYGIFVTPTAQLNCILRHIM